MRCILIAIALALMSSGAAHADVNIFDGIANTHPWVRASIIAIPGESPTLYPTLSLGAGYSINQKTSLTLQYRALIGAPNQTEFGITRAIW